MEMVLENQEMRTQEEDAVASFILFSRGFLYQPQNRLIRRIMMIWHSIGILFSRLILNTLNLPFT